MKKCKICGKEENGYGSLLNKNEVCLSCYLKQKWTDDRTDELYVKVLTLEKKLEIATKTLEEIYNNSSLKDDFSDHKEMAFNALKQIQEVK